MSYPIPKNPMGYFPPPQFPAPEGDNDSEDDINCQWYDPPPDSLPVNFCLDTSIHGLRYVGQPRRNILERVFWLCSVSAAIGAASYLIWQLYNNYGNMPIVTIFSPSETTIDQIPFPAVTICNVNNIQKSKFEKAQGQALAELLKNKPPDENANRIYAKLYDILHICEASNTFTGKYAKTRTLAGVLGKHLSDLFFNNKTHEFEKFADPTKTVFDSGQSCSEMIRYCIWQDEIRNCSVLFEEIETDYGYCCVMNLIPLSLLFKPDSRDNKQRVDEWASYNITYDNLLFTSETMDRKHPFRQLYPGKEGGLSVLLDPDLDEYQCPNTDSKGFAVSLNVPLDFPRIKDYGIAVEPNSEVWINVRPELTVSDKSIESFDQKKRQCYFAEEYKLPHYKKYTTQNCNDECIATETKRKCKCVRYYMPHNKNDKICRPPQYECTANVRQSIHQEGLGKCGMCFPTCTEIEYRTEITSLPIDQERADRILNGSLFDKLFKNHHDASIVHIYFGVDSTYARLRTESATTNDLISSAGGILGLCLGVSVLSLFEIIYYFTIRLTCNCFRDRKDADIVMRLENAASRKFHKRQQWMPVIAAPSGYSSKIQRREEHFRDGFNQRGYGGPSTLAMKYDNFI